MKKRLGFIAMMTALSFLFLLTLELGNFSSKDSFGLSGFFPKSYSQTFCSPPAPSCGPLMSNSSGSRFCCANTNTECCYAAGCGGGNT